MERRNLAAAYKFYCGRKMEEDFVAHKADQDTEATYRVLMGQLDMYEPGRQEEPERQLYNDMDELAELSKTNDNVDFAGRIVWKPMLDKDGKPLLDSEGKPRRHEVFNFGKYKGWDVAEILRKDPGYYSWMLGHQQHQAGSHEDSPARNAKVTIENKRYVKRQEDSIGHYGQHRCL